MTFDRVPAEPPASVWTGEMSARLDLQDDAAKNVLRPSLQPDDFDADLPVVSVGQPEVLKSFRSLTAPGFKDLVPKDFYLVRLWCSFRGFGTDLEFERAHFKVALRGPDDVGPLTARDMYPTEVLHKVKRDVRVGLAPEVKFAEVSAKAVDFEYGFTYDELQPQIVAAGQGESTPSWAFARTKGRRLEGGKAMHLLVAAPKGTTQADAEIELTAYVTKPGFVALPFGLFEKRGEAPPATLRVRLW